MRQLRDLPGWTPAEDNIIWRDSVTRDGTPVRAWINVTQEAKVLRAKHPGRTVEPQVLE